MNYSKIKLVLGLNDLAIGGAQRLAVDQLKLLDRNKFDLYLITLKQCDWKSDFYSEIPEDVKVIKLRFDSYKNISSWIKLYKILSEIKPDIVKSTLVYSNTIFGVLKMFIGYKLITAEHNTNLLKNWYQIFLNKIIDRNSYTKVVDSKMVAEYLSETEKINIDRFTVIYNGVDQKEIDKAINEFVPLKKKFVKNLALIWMRKSFLVWLV